MPNQTVVPLIGEKFASKKCLEKKCPTRMRYHLIEGGVPPKKKCREKNEQQN